MEDYSHFHFSKMDNSRIWFFLVIIVASLTLFSTDGSAVVFDSRKPSSCERQRILYGGHSRGDFGATGCMMFKPTLGLTPKASLRCLMSPVKKQEGRNTCNAFAAVALLEYDTVYRFSEQCLVKMSSNEDPGTTRQRIEWALEHGLYSEHICPYSQDRNLIPDLKYAEPFPALFSMQLFKHDLDPVEEIRSAINHNRPIGISVFVIGRWWSDLQDKTVLTLPNEKEIQAWQAKCDKDEEHCFSHALVVTGYDEVTRSVEFKNSWGTGYKDGGYGRMSYDYLRRFYTGNPFVTVSPKESWQDHKAGWGTTCGTSWPPDKAFLDKLMPVGNVQRYGCHKGYCWAYKFEDSLPGDPWCYTQQKGVPGGRKAWARCSKDNDCDWDRTCGDDKLYFGSNDINPLIYEGESDTAFLHMKYNNCRTRPGNQCGCHKGYCWAYKFENSRGGDPWCYTQNRGVPGNQKAWAKCSTNYDCDWNMTCGDNKLYFGSDEINAIIYGGESDAASLRAKSSNCGAKPGNQCGCHKGYCWAYKFENSRGGDPWCYTQNRGVPGNQKAWAKCSTNYDCDWNMTCGDNKLFFGSDEINAVIYGGETNASSLKFKYRKM